MQKTNRPNTYCRFCFVLNLTQHKSFKLTICQSACIYVKKSYNLTKCGFDLLKIYLCMFYSHYHYFLKEISVEIWSTCTIK